jgi:hypothetical protein
MPVALFTNGEDAFSASFRVRSCSIIHPGPDRVGPAKVRDRPRRPHCQARGRVHQDPGGQETRFRVQLVSLVSTQTRICTFSHFSFPLIAARHFQSASACPSARPQRRETKWRPGGTQSPGWGSPAPKPVPMASSAPDSPLSRLFPRSFASRSSSSSLCESGVLSSTVSSGIFSLAHDDRNMADEGQSKHGDEGT